MKKINFFFVVVVVFQMFVLHRLVYSYACAVMARAISQWLFYHDYLDYFPSL